jgi:Tfp pilus assembly protein FimV
LLVVQTRGDSANAVELVHESLIHSWPTLQRWLDENQEHSAYLAQVRVTAKQWDAKGRPQGLLWRGEAFDEARLFRARYQGGLPDRERTYLDAVIAHGTRAIRRRRIGVIGAMAFLAMMAVGAGVLAERANDAKAAAEHERQLAEDERQLADDNARKAREAQAEATKQAQTAEAASTLATEEKTAAEDALARERAALTDTAKAKAQATASQLDANAKAAQVAAEKQKREAEEKRKQEQDSKITKTLK